MRASAFICEDLLDSCEPCFASLAQASTCSFVMGERDAFSAEETHFRYADRANGDAGAMRSIRLDDAG